jgi:D-3-phosphoglycerate dehydrogenase
VNIAQMSVGRGTDKPGGDAIGVLSLDAKPPAEALAEILAMPHVPRAWIAKLPPAGQLPPWLGE